MSNGHSNIKNFLEVSPWRQSVPKKGAKLFLGYNSTLGCSGREFKMCFSNYMNRAFKWIQKHHDSKMKLLTEKFQFELKVTSFNERAFNLLFYLYKAQMIL